MLFVRTYIIEPFLGFESVHPGMVQPHFYLLIIAVILVAAGGNIINDIKDVSTDQQNSKSSIPVLIVGEKLSWELYYLTTAIGVATGSYVSLISGSSIGPTLFILSAGILYYYSIYFKSTILIGNIFIALLSALVVCLPLLVDKQAFSSSNIIIITLAYGVFAFLISLAREIIKDCEDVHGDEQTGIKTFAVIYGIEKALKLSIGILTLTTLSLIYIQVTSQQWNSIIPFLYVISFIEIPLLTLIILFIFKKGSKRLKYYSTSLKLIMAAGISSMLIFNYFS